jgi:predicted MFS family arabinose efflux permease
LLALAGPGWCFFATAFGNAMLFVSYLLLRLPPRKVETHQSAFAQLLAGLRWVRRDEVFFMLFMAGGMTAFIQPYQSMMPVFAKNALDVGTVQLGILLAAPGVGALVGSLSVAIIGRSARRGRLMFMGSLTAAAALFAFSFAPAIAVALPLLAVIGISNAFFMTMNNTITLERAPAELRGRVMSVMIVIWGLSPVGATVAGLVADAVDVRFALALGASLAASVTLTILVRRPSLRAM